jgi:ubiquitin-activating enzyme E1
LGTKANSAICIPFKTPSYSEGVVAGEGQGIAKCTLRNFPSLPLHCIEWAREKFDDLFVVDADNVNSLLEDREAFFAKIAQSPLEARDALTNTKRWLELSKTPSLEICVKMMFEEFLKQYRDQIKDLITNFPEDSRNTQTTEDGKVIDLGPFWHGHKRFPFVADFNADNVEHLDFIYHGTHILARAFNIPETVTKEKVKELVSKLKAPEWKFSGKKIELDEENKENKDKEAKEKEEKKKEPELSDDDAEEVKKLIAHLRTLDLKDYKKLRAEEFEKDDDKNHHVDFITSATNLRAYNYQIKYSKKQECRMIAGRIIPAIATTTAMITGFVQLEISKYLKQVPIEKHRMVTVNLAVNNYTLELLPDPIKKKSGLDQATQMEVKAVPENWTTWDKVKIDADDVSLEKFLEVFKEQHHGCTIDTLTSSDGKLLYLWTDKPTFEKNKKRKLTDVYEEVSGKIFPPARKYLVLECSGEDPDSNTALIPRIIYQFKK